jgi:hypothetical protein
MPTNWLGARGVSRVFYEGSGNLLMSAMRRYHPNSRGFDVGQRTLAGRLRDEFDGEKHLLKN